jgi:hypothetical protein
VKHQPVRKNQNQNPYPERVGVSRFSRTRPPSVDQPPDHRAPMSAVMRHDDPELVEVRGEQRNDPDVAVAIKLVV